MRVHKLALALVPIGFLAAACSTTLTLAQADVESQVAQYVATDSGVAVEDIDVTCPGDLDGTIDATMTCTVASGDQTTSALLTVTSIDGTTVEFSIAEVPAS